MPSPCSEAFMISLRELLLALTRRALGLLSSSSDEDEEDREREGDSDSDFFFSPVSTASKSIFLGSNDLLTLCLLLAEDGEAVPVVLGERVEIQLKSSELSPYMESTLSMLGGGVTVFCETSGLIALIGLRLGLAYKTVREE